MLKKSFGQHFLHDQHVIDQIVDAAMIASDELVVEVGPGGGALTERLEKRAMGEGSLILIESDRDLIPSLQNRFPDAKIVQADAAQVDYDTFTGGRPWVFVSNLPYNAGNAILERVLQSKYLPRRLVIMVQKEVGERMMAKPGDMSLLSVAIQMYCDVERVCIVKPGAFNPPPKVDSIVLRLSSRRLATNDQRPELIISLAKIGFAHRRKQLRSTLAAGNVATIERIDAVFESLGLAKTVRPQELSVEQWKELRRLI